MKRCNICQIDKPVSAFNTDSSRPDGYAYRCKPCHKILIRKGVVREDLKTGPKARPIEDRFWPKVVKGPGCWAWIGAKTSFGYGKISISRSQCIHARRVSWAIHFGEISGNLNVLHKCDNPECTNPEHLFLGTNKDNVHDMIKKNRHSHGHQHWEAIQRGKHKN